jgi:DNA-binding response OmpR family regulator
MNRLLIVDENPCRGQSYERFLRRAGYDVVAVTAPAGKDLLPFVCRTAPDLLIVRTPLPGDGVAGLLGSLREQTFPGSMPPVILLGNEPIHEVRRLLQPPVVAYLPEPVAAETLLARLQWALQEKNVAEDDPPCERRSAMEIPPCVEAGT